MSNVAIKIIGDNCLIFLSCFSYLVIMCTSVLLLCGKFVSLLLSSGSKILNYCQRLSGYLIINLVLFYIAFLYLCLCTMFLCKLHDSYNIIITVSLTLPYSRR